MTFWFYDPETNTLRFGNCDEDLPLCASIREWSRAASPALWFGTIIGLLKLLGHDLPPIPKGKDTAAVLVFWDKDGEAAFFPLTTSECTTEDAAELGHVLHHVAQVMIEDPDAWFPVTVPEEDGMEDGEEEEGDFGDYLEVR